MTSLKQKQFAALAGLTPAVVVVDAQVDFAAPEIIGEWCETPDDLAAVQAAVDQMARLVQGARAAGVPVVWVELATQEFTWTSDNWFRLGSRDLSMGEARPCLAGTRGAAWFGPLTPAAGELRVAKDAYSGFIGTDLDAQLRAAGIDWLIIVGLTTECCVLSTVNDAMQHDWQVLVAADATAAYSSYLHEAGLKLMSLNSAVISEVDEVLGLISVTP